MGQEKKEQAKESKEHEDVARLPNMTEEPEEMEEESSIAQEAATSETAHKNDNEKPKDQKLRNGEKEETSTVSTISACYGVQLGRRQLRQIPHANATHAGNKRAVVMIPSRKNNDTCTMPNNNVTDDDEEAVFHSVSPPMEQENSTNQGDDIAPSFDIQDDEESIDIEQDAGVENTPAENQESITSDEDTATGVFSAYLAPTREEARRRMLANAVVATNVRAVPTSEPTSENRWRTPLIVVTVIICAALAISLGVTLSGRNNDDAITSMSPTPAPTSTRFGQAASLVESFFNISFEDPSTPEYQAAQWIADVDSTFEDLATIDSDRFGQRYVLALFYFATGGPTSWIKTSFFLKSGIHECEWGDTAPEGTYSFSSWIGVYNCSMDMQVEGIEVVKII